MKSYCRHFASLSPSEIDALELKAQNDPNNTSAFRNSDAADARADSVNITPTRAQSADNGPLETPALYARISGASSAVSLSRHV